jgi:NAD(P)-dependent dehydrogenase (short-subunit alcohol dehydrogenase family)
MPQLKNARWEAFAQGHARGLNAAQARGAAGYSARGAQWRVCYSRGVKARIAELLAQHATLREAGLEETILALLDLATRTDAKTAAGAREARASRLEAHRLSGLLGTRRKAETWTPPPEMTEAEWDAKYGPDAPGSKC